MQTLIVIVSLVLVQFATNAFAQSGPAAGEVSVHDVDSSGQGCPRDSIGYYLSPDATTFTLIFDKFTVDLSTHPRIPRIAKFCNVRLRLQVPKTWSFAVLALDTRGYADLAAGVTGTLGSRLKIGEGSHRRIADLVLNGPFQNNYLRTLDVPLNDRAWTACRGNGQHLLQINTEIAVQRPPGANLTALLEGRARIGSPQEPPRGLMTVDTIDGELLQKYKISWRRCSN